jgi:hypothetical protein
MWAVRSDVPWLITVMTCERLSSDRKLGKRKLGRGLRDETNSCFHYSFSLIQL